MNMYIHVYYIHTDELHACAQGNDSAIDVMP